MSQGADWPTPGPVPAPASAASAPAASQLPDAEVPADILPPLQPARIAHPCHTPRSKRTRPIFSQSLG